MKTNHDYPLRIPMMSLFAMSEAAALTQLLINEAIRQFDQATEPGPMKQSVVNTGLFEMGKKPGFAIAARLPDLKRGIPDIQTAANYISTQLLPLTFGVEGKHRINDKTISISFPIQPPPCFACFVPGVDQLEEGQISWTEAIFNFMSGVIVGALAHFGFIVSHVVRGDKEKGTFDPTKTYLDFFVDQNPGVWMSPPPKHPLTKADV